MVHDCCNHIFKLWYSGDVLCPFGIYTFMPELIVISEPLVIIWLYIFLVPKYVKKSPGEISKSIDSIPFLVIIQQNTFVMLLLIFVCKLKDL